MGITVSHSRHGDSRDVSIATATVRAPLHGRLAVFSLSGYNFSDHFATAGGNAITFGMRPASPDEATVGMGATLDGMFRLQTGRRVLEQSIAFPNIYGDILGFSDLNGLVEGEGEVGAGREISSAVLRKFESVFETTRQYIKRNFGSNIRSHVADAVDKMYGQATAETIASILGAVNWGFLLSIDGRTMPVIGEQALNIINYTLAHNTPSSHPLPYDGESDIPLFVNQAISFDQQSLADMRATTLLMQVCGKEHGETFKRYGHVTIEKNNYRFVLRPNQFVDCTDPNGKTAKLCIHTVRLSCNPIDEVIIAYLNILHHFDEFMATAIYHGDENGFLRPRKAA